MRMHRGQTLIAALTMVLPALPLFILGMTPEYWGSIYLWWGAIFAILSFISASRTIRRSVNDGVQWPSFRQFFIASLIAWLISFVALAIIDFTPLCLGQDNGDGTNNFETCILLTIIWPVGMSIFVVPLICLASVIARKTVRNPV